MGFLHSFNQSVKKEKEKKRKKKEKQPVATSRVRCHIRSVVMPCSLIKSVVDPKSKFS